LLSNPLIPIITVTIERAFPITVDSDIITADYQGCWLILIPNLHWVVQPVCDIGAPLVRDVDDQQTRYVIPMFNIARHVKEIGIPKGYRGCRYQHPRARRRS
jgi:hypothetical protein